MLRTLNGMETEMKLKAGLMLGVLALILTAVGISPAHAAAAPAVNAPSTPALPASFLCSLNQSVDPGLAKTDSLIPAPKLATTFPPPCGTCSDFDCRGHSVGAVCGSFALTHWCYAFGSVCKPTTDIQCRCSHNVP